ncbi:hypothetical protein SLEP1_g27103 [Rubroshorea leprosula]|uniref:Uncharacterized protein n=1 Tax=Rubroshorea leprosula TaxID=152421 RepID=A0AAV5JPD7_9ROSI|nr:hypothetical protein SLEP1_g27103 [Rubroshorea leprosula]
MDFIKIGKETEKRGINKSKGFHSFSTGSKGNQTDGKR